MTVLRLLAVVLMVGFVTDQFPYGTVTFGYDGFAVDTVHYFPAEGDYVLYRVFYDDRPSEEIIGKGGAHLPDMPEVGEHAAHDDGNYPARRAAR